MMEDEAPPVHMVISFMKVGGYFMYFHTQQLRPQNILSLFPESLMETLHFFRSSQNFALTQMKMEGKKKPWGREWLF